MIDIRCEALFAGTSTSSETQSIRAWLDVCYSAICSMAGCFVPPCWADVLVALMSAAIFNQTSTSDLTQCLSQNLISKN